MNESDSISRFVRSAVQDLAICLALLVGIVMLLLAILGG